MLIEGGSRNRGRCYRPLSRLAPKFNLCTSWVSNLPSSPCRKLLFAQRPSPPSLFFLLLAVLSMDLLEIIMDWGERLLLQQ